MRLVVEQVEVEIHLARELRLEGADLEIEGDERLEEAVIEEQINEILLLAQREAVLPPRLNVSKRSAPEIWQSPALSVTCLCASSSMRTPVAPTG